MNKHSSSPTYDHIADLLRDLPHHADISSQPADPGALFEIRKQWAQLLRTSALPAPPNAHAEVTEANRDQKVRWTFAD